MTKGYCIRDYQCKSFKDKDADKFKLLRLKRSEGSGAGGHSKDDGGEGKVCATYHYSINVQQSVLIVSDNGEFGIFTRWHDPLEDSSTRRKGGEKAVKYLIKRK